MIGKWFCSRHPNEFLFKTDKRYTMSRLCRRCCDGMTLNAIMATLKAAQHPKTYRTVKGTNSFGHPQTYWISLENQAGPSRQRTSHDRTRLVVLTAEAVHAISVQP